MPAAFPALEALAWLTFAVALVLAVTIKYWLTPIFSAVNHTIGHIPYVGGAIRGGEDAVMHLLNGVIASSRHAMTTLWQGLRWSLNELITGVRDFADSVADNWQQLLEVALPGALGLVYAAAKALADAVLGELHTLEATVTSNLRAAQSYADSAVSHATAAVERYTDQATSDLWDRTVSHVHGVYQEVEADIAAASSALTRYVDVSVNALEQAEDAAVAAARAAAASALESAHRELDAAIDAVAAAVEALHRTLEGELAGEKASAAAALAATAADLRTVIAGGVATAEQVASAALEASAATIEADISHSAAAAADALQATATALQGSIGDVAQLEQATVAELSSAEQAAAGELTDIYGLPADQLRALLDRLDLTKVLGFGAGLVLLRSLVEAIAAESGLEDATCRAKHKQVCGVDPGEWTDLLAGAAFLTGALSLAELVPIGRATFHELTDVIRLAA